MNCKNCNKISWRKTENGFMMRCEEHGRHEVFVGFEEFRLDRGLLPKQQEQFTLNLIKDKFECKK